MDTILNIDTNETKTVGITKETVGTTGSLDFLTDNNSAQN